MNVWRIHHVRKWFLICVIAITLIWGAFITAFVFCFQIKERLYIVGLIVFGLYAIFSVYYLLKQCLFRFLPYCKKEGSEITGVMTYKIPSTGEEALRPLAIIEVDQKKHAIGLLGMFDHSSRKTLKEGQRVTLYKIKGEPMALLLEIK